jgi:hypothetical protein
MAGKTTEGRMNITGLDFEDIKNNLKIYLKGQSHFTDYDFEGSGMNILLDVLAYNTHYQAFYANMLANEMFLDTAVKRNSVVSHAKVLGYTPRSVQAPTAYLKVQVHDANTPSITMPEGYLFTTTIDGRDYQFVNTEDRTITPTSSGSATQTYVFGDDGIGIPVYEGSWTETKFTVDLTDVDQRFIIPNINVDMSTILVSVQTSSVDTFKETFTKANDLIDVDAATRAFFIQETIDNKWEIYFGDDAVGKALIDGNIISIKYVVTNVEAANGVSSFNAGSGISGFSNIEVTTITSSSGGATAENLASIRYNAPLHFASQNRGVTATDYKALLPQLYGDIESIAVWGGEFANPPVYGKVYISIKPHTGSNLTNVVKDNLKSQLKKYTVASITPVFVDPDITKIIPNISFKFNEFNTTKTALDIETLIAAKVAEYSDEYLEQFEGVFRHSKFTNLIDKVDDSILSNITTIQISQALTPTLATISKYTMDFNNPLHHPHAGHQSILKTTGFVLEGGSDILYLNDDGEGNIRTYKLVGSSTSYVDLEAGTIDYDTGQLILTSFNIISAENTDGTITITVTPASNDIVAVRNQLLLIDTTNLKVTGESDTIASGSANAGTGYSTTATY